MSRERASKEGQPQKLTVVLPSGSFNSLVELAERRHTTRTNVLKRAISDQVFFADQISQGREIQIFDPANNQTTRVIWAEDYVPSGERLPVEPSES